MRVAVLNDARVLAGYRDLPEGAEPEANEIEVPIDCDLTVNRYKWDGTAFIPLGGGFGKPTTPPVASDYAIFLILKALRDGKPIPAPALAWMDWYEKTLAPRHAERQG